MKKSLLLVAAAFALVAAQPQSSCAGTLYFIQQQNKFWNNVLNWFVPDPDNPGAFTPASKIPSDGDDDVVIKGGECDATGITFQPKTSFTVTALTSVTGGNFDVFTFNFSESKAGTGSNGLNGTVINIKASGSMNFTLANTGLANCQIIMQGGSFVYQASTLTISGSTIFNQGSWVLQPGTSLIFLGSASRFDNIGDLRGNGGTTQLVGGPHLTFNNSGTIRADSGTLFLNGNIIWAADDGTGSFYPFTDNALININGAFVVPANTTTYFKGPGNVATLGNVTVNGTLSVGVPASGPTKAPGVVWNNKHPAADPGKWLIKGNATIAGGGVIQIDENSEASVESNGVVVGEGFAGKAKILKDGKLNIKGTNNDGTGTFTMLGGSLENEGTVTINVQRMEVRNCTLTNYSLVEVTAPAGIVSTGSPAPVFNNEAGATWNAVGGTGSNPPAGFSGITTNAPLFNNDGTLNVTGTGTFQITGGNSNGGTFNYTPNLSFVTQLYSTSAFAQFKGPGSAVCQNFGGLNPLDSEFVAIYRLAVRNNGVLDGPGTINVENQFDWEGGTIRGPGNLNLGPNCRSTMCAVSDLVFIDRIIANRGTATWTCPGNIQASEGATWNNLTGATFDVQNDGLFNGSVEETPTFNNLTGGLFKKSAGTGTSIIGINFNNEGTVDLQSGRTNFYNFTQLNGTTLLNGGTFGTVGGTPIMFRGGSCNGNGTINGDVTIDTIIGNIQMNLGPGLSAGQITINGNYTQKPDAILNIEVAGLTTPGVDYDLLAVTGTATLGGRLRVTAINGFKPGPNDTIAPLTANSIVGKFDWSNAQVNYGGTSLTVAALASPPSQLLNISTRMRVQTGDNVLIGGFIITGNNPKKVIIRGIGPSLSGFFSGALDNPTLELFQGNTLLQSNDDWKNDQQSEIEATGIPPSHALESAIVRTLSPGNYTAILRGKNNGTGIGVVEAYDLDQAANSKLANIATRGFVETGNNVMIGGLIVGPADGSSAKVVVRAIGPSLTNFGIAGALQDPTLELVNSSGTVLRSNDNWKDSQQAEIMAIGLQPPDERESTLVHTVAPGAYTAIVRGSGNTTGVSLVEVYNVP